MASHLDMTTISGVRRITLDRPEIHNAFDDVLIAELGEAFRAAADDDAVRSIVLRGNGQSFCAGADLGWMKRMVSYGVEENVRDSTALADLFLTIDRCPKPVVGRVHGAALGGGAGLVAVCDIAIGVPLAKIGFTEVKLGILPAVISPYVVRKIGVGHARELFLTGERIDGTRAAEIGLLNHVVAPELLDEAVERILGLLNSSGPRAMRAAKELIRTVAHREPAEVSEATVSTIARVRVSDEGQEGMAAFLEKRAPAFKAT